MWEYRETCAYSRKNVSRLYFLCQMLLPNHNTVKLYSFEDSIWLNYRPIPMDNSSVGVKCVSSLEISVYIFDKSQASFSFLYLIMFVLSTTLFFY